MFINGKEWEKLNEKVEDIADEMKHIKQQRRIKGEFYAQNTSWGHPYWIWKKFTADNILDELDGYIKLMFHFYIMDAVGRVEIHHTSAINVPGELVTADNTTLWLKKDCIVWHDKDIYAEEKKKIEKKQKKGEKK